MKGGGVARRLGRFDHPARLENVRPESIFSADSLTVSLQRPCAVAYTNLCER